MIKINNIKFIQLCSILIVSIFSTNMVQAGPMLINMENWKSGPVPPIDRNKICECICTTHDGAILVTTDSFKVTVNIKTHCLTVQKHVSGTCTGYSTEDMDNMLTNGQLDPQKYLETPKRTGNFVCKEWLSDQQLIDSMFSNIPEGRQVYLEDRLINRSEFDNLTEADKRYLIEQERLRLRTGS